MKRLIIFLLVTVIITIIAVNCASAGKAASFFQAIEQVAEEITFELTAGKRIAIASFESNNSNLTEFITEELTGALFDRGIEVADRQNLAFVYKELNFQMSGDVSDESARSIGKFMVADIVITGQFIDMGSSFNLQIKAVNIGKEIRPRIIKIKIYKDHAIQSMIASMSNQNNLTKTAKYGVSEDTEPNTAGTYFDRGILFIRRGWYDMAISDFSEALKLNPDMRKAYWLRGFIYYKQGNYDQAITEYDQMIRLDPNSAEGYHSRGEVYQEKREYEKAITDYTQAIKLEPEAAIYNNRGNTYQDKQEYVLAINDYNQAIRLDNNFQYAYINRGNAYVKIKEYDKAIQDYSIAINLNLDYTLAYFNRGWAYFQRGNFEKAISDWETVLRIDPNTDGVKKNIELAKTMQKIFIVGD